MDEGHDCSSSLSTTMRSLSSNSATDNRSSQLVQVDNPQSDEGLVHTSSRRSTEAVIGLAAIHQGLQSSRTVSRERLSEHLLAFW